MVAALGVLGAPPAAEAKKAPKGCKARGTKTLLETSRARVFTRRDKDGGRDVFACLNSNGRKRRLGIRGDCAVGAAADHIRLAGFFVGYVSTACNIDTTNSFVVVRDLRTGRVKWTAEGATGPPSPDTGDHSSKVAGFEMRPNGSAVWIGVFIRDIGGSPTDRQVRKLEPGSPADGALVDSGLRIDGRSLALSSSGGTAVPFYWKKDGVVQSDLLH
jgi:hypothetical protein